MALWLVGPKLHRIAILPLFAQIADDPPRLARGLVKTIGLVCFTMVPILFGLIAIAPQFLPLLIGETNGRPSVPALQALLAIGGAGGVYSIMMQALTASERSGIAFSWSLANLGLRFVLGALAMTFSATMVVASFATASYIILPLMLRQAGQLFGINVTEAWAEIWRPTCIGAVMLALVLGLGWVGQAWPITLLLGLQITVGMAVYIGLSVVFNRTQLSTMQSLLAGAVSR